MRRIFGINRFLPLVILLSTGPGLAQPATSGVRWVTSQDQQPPDAWGVYDLESRKWVNQASKQWGSASVPPGQYSIYLRWKPDDQLIWWTTLKVYDGTFTPVDSRQHLALLNGIAQLVKHAYVEPPPMESAVNGALVSMLESIDSYSSYVNAATYKSLDHGQQASPGLIVSKRFGYLYVVSVVEGSSADQSGLYSGSLIESIQGTTTAFMSLWEAEQRLKGVPGSKVEIRVILSRSAKPIQLTLEREVVEPSALSMSTLEGGITLLHLPHFNPGVAQELGAILAGLHPAQPRGLVIDLRGTAEGSLHESVETADLFLEPETTIMTLSARGNGPEEFTARAEATLAGVPIVVLIDRGTSGAAEVFAAALQDHGLAQTLGIRSNGEGGIQEKQTLEDGSVMILTTRQVLRSTGDPIQSTDARKSGINPSLRWPDLSFETRFYYDHLPAEGEVGPEFYRSLHQAIREEQVRKAIEIIHETLKTRKRAA